MSMRGWRGIWRGYVCIKFNLRELLLFRGVSVLLGSLVIHVFCLVLSIVLSYLSICLSACASPSLYLHLSLRSSVEERLISPYVCPRLLIVAHQETPLPPMHQSTRPEGSCFVFHLSRLSAYLISTSRLPLPHTLYSSPIPHSPRPNLHSYNPPLVPPS
jgi:hypothetical protein